MSGPFHSTAHLYDFVYSFLDYEGSARMVEEVVRGRNPGARTLLDVACGTGKHLELLARSFEVEGTDIDPAMLEIAASRNPGIALHPADMETLSLGRTYDAVICMFSSIAYAHTAERMNRAMAAMAAHLSPGGVLVVEPWLWPELITPPLVRIQTVEEPGRVVARTSRMTIEGAVSRVEFTYLVTTDVGSEMFTEQHVTGLFTPDEYAAAIRAAGLGAEFLPDGPTGRGLAVGVNPA